MSDGQRDISPPVSVLFRKNMPKMKNIPSMCADIRMLERQYAAIISVTATLCSAAL